jgi:hypothetical protein
MEALAAMAHRDRLRTAWVTAQRVAKAVRAALAAQRSQARRAMVATVATAVQQAPGVMDRILRHQVRLASMVAPEEVLVPAVLEVPAGAQPLGKTAMGAMAATVAVRAMAAMVAMALLGMQRQLMVQRAASAAMQVP